MFAGLVSLAVAAVAFTLMRPGIWALAILALALPVPLVVAFDAASTARAAARPFALQPCNRWYVYVGAVVLAAGARAPVSDVLEAFRMPSGSMQPTLLPGDWFYVDKRTSARQNIRTGDLIVYRSPDDNATVVKRVVGIGGDTLSMRGDTLRRNGSAITEPYVDWLRLAGDSAGTRDFGVWGPVVIPGAHLFVLGDDRHSSKDSRHVGAVPIASVVGKPTLIYYSYDRDADTPLPFITAVRWPRLGKVPR